MFRTIPGSTRAKGSSLARKAVALEPNNWAFLNTLGVAAFRARDWKTATEVLQQSITFTGGGAHDLFFLAMTYWQQGNKEEARTFYDRAVAWTDKHKPKDPELRRFRAEAAALLGQPCKKPNSEEEHLRKDGDRPDLAQKTKQPVRGWPGRTSSRQRPTNGTGVFMPASFPVRRLTAAEKPARGCENTAARGPGQCFPESRRA